MIAKWKLRLKRIATYIVAPRSLGAYVKVDELAPGIAFRMCVPCGLIYKKQKDEFTAKRCPSCRKLRGQKLYVEAMP